jgi:hypothetical protein
MEKKNEIEIKNEENHSDDYQRKISKYFCGCTDKSCSLIHFSPIKK